MVIDSSAKTRFASLFEPLQACARVALLGSACGGLACSGSSSTPADACPDVEPPSAPDCPSTPGPECMDCPAGRASTSGTTTATSTTGEPEDPTNGVRIDVGDGLVHDVGVRGEPWDPDAVRIGWASVDMTPPLNPPVLMRNDETATGVMDPITATAMVIESPANPDDTVVLVSLDLLRIPDGKRYATDLVTAVRETVAEQRPEIPVEQLILSATHTHAAPVIISDVVPHYADRVTEAVTEAWDNRQPSALSYGLGHAVAGHNRIVSYHDGSSLMYGSEGGTPTAADFSHIEGFEDHSVDLLFTFDATKRVTGVVVNVTCPSQVQRGTEISADFWHEVREELDERLETPIHILPQVSASGDIATTAVVKRVAEERMARLRYPELESKDAGDEDWRPLRRKQIAHRIVETILDVLPYMDEVMEQTPQLGHIVQEVELTPGCATPEPGETHSVELHGIRISDVTMITNPFELYLDYGTRIRGRSPSIQTFVVELAGSGTYLPTHRAVAGGAYGSTEGQCSLVGPDGGNELVEESLAILDALWAEGSVSAD